MDPLRQTVPASRHSANPPDYRETTQWLAVLLQRIRDSADPNTRLAPEELQRLQYFVPLHEIDPTWGLSLTKLCQSCQVVQAVTHKNGTFYCQACVTTYECLCKQEMPKDEGFKCSECGTRTCWRCFFSRNQRGEVQCPACMRGSQSTTVCPLCMVEVPLSEVYFRLCPGNHVACKKCAAMCKLEGHCLLDGQEYAQQELVCEKCEKHLDLTITCENCEKAATKYYGLRKCAEDCQVCFDCQTTYNLKNMQASQPICCVCCGESIG